MINLGTHENKGTIFLKQIILRNTIPVTNGGSGADTLHIVTTSTIGPTHTMTALKLWVRRD